MPNSHFRPEPSLIPERPRCTKCQGRMRLALIEPGPRSGDLRTFECAECGHTARVVVADALMSDRAQGWADSHLYPPK
jgi:hypothetical protein